MATEEDKKILNLILNPLLPVGEVLGSITQDEGDGEQSLTDEEKKAEAIEVEAVSLAEQGRIQEALSRFDEAVSAAPSRASCYNNRAQARRLLNDIEGALVDLNNAINLSGGKGKAAAQAFCQRGMIYRLQGKDDLALKDFDSASKLGNTFAKSQVAQLNPYAALCNKMLHDVFEKLKSGEYCDKEE